MLAVKRIALILFCLCLPVISALGGGFGGAWLVVAGPREWQSLGAPPNRPVQILGLCEGTICVETFEGQRYRYHRKTCRQPAEQTCWIEVISTTVMPLVPELANPCLFEYDVPSPPRDAIQTVGAKVCHSGGDQYIYYALLEDGSIWHWEHDIGDMASLGAFFFGGWGVLFGLGAGLFVAGIIFWLGWPQRKAAATVQEKNDG